MGTPFPAQDTGSETPYLPGLDGIRAIAVAAVVAYHLEAPWLPGGLLGVGVFFTLSGYLITSILRSTWERTGDLDLGDFWRRRARRLLPAVIMVLAVVLAATVILDTAAIAKRSIEALAVLFFVNNWTTIAAGASYFQRFGGPGPLDHLWSLAVEEQFYLVWPLILLALYRVLRGNLRRMALVTLVLALISFVLMWLFAAPGFDNTRAYEGTDTRAGALLIGATLAMVWHPNTLAKEISARGRLVVNGLGVGGLATIGVLFTRTNEYSLSLYRGGILSLSLATALVVASAVHPASMIGRALGLRPLRWVGERSYGIYLWHLPIVAFMPTAALAAQPVARAGVQVVLIVLLSALSWMLVEDPIRRHGLLAALRRSSSEIERTRPAERDDEPWLSDSQNLPCPKSPPSAMESSQMPLRTRTPALISSAGVVLLIAMTSLTAAAALRPPGAAGAGDQLKGINLEAPPLPTDRHRGDTSSKASKLHTSCKQVVHIGDSTSIGLISAAYQPTKKNWIDAQYHKVGVQNVYTDIAGARSIVERWHHQPNAQDAVQFWLNRGYPGCWVMAMGTNEAANQTVGGSVTSRNRIDLVMKLIGDRPVLWLTVKTQNSSGPYADRGMQEWNQALAEACTRYPNMRVYDWASQVKNGWFIDDGIHFTSKGYAERSKRIARALATAFPQRGTAPAACLLTPAR
jgi:peptidoglycan/LPS O-acetylase OafA/YrhL